MATGSLDANGIWLYGEDDSEPTASALLNKLGNSISDKFDGGLPIANGGTGATTVADAQDSLRVGLVPISPSTVEKAGAGSTATANTLGQVTFASCTSLSLNGVFTSAYKNYRINLNMTPSAPINTVFLRMRAVGTDNTSSTYSTILIFTNSGSIGKASYVSQTSAEVSYIETGTSFEVIELAYPAVATVTRGVRTSNYQKTSTGIEVVNSAFQHSVASSFDGFTIYPATGNFTGTIQVFGYNE